MSDDYNTIIILDEDDTDGETLELTLRLELLEALNSLQQT